MVQNRILRAYRSKPNVIIELSRVSDIILGARETIRERRENHELEKREVQDEACKDIHELL